VRKDYVSIEAGAGALDEAAFVERFWTEQWRDRSGPPDSAAVGRRDEYRIMRQYLGALPPGSRLLDGGCGTGEWTVFLSQQGFHVVGADISRETIVRLQQWFPDLEFVHMDLRQTSFADAAFDAYFSWGTFEHFESGLGACLSEAHRIVKPGGWLFVSVPTTTGA
jgi:ubiquinone/menaquinone biosynthesis C-methylase UbiE